jgi:RNA ligase (TIGR02306 family)
MKFLESSDWRVRMRKFKGAPSEVVIMPYAIELDDMPIGFDCTLFMGVTKYFKPVPAHMQGKAKGDFPQFIPKTDELNYQRHPELIDSLHGKPYYVTEKADGSSTTAYKYKGQFGVCSRNYELLPDENNGYWEIANRYQLETKLPEGYALQWETCGPKIQSNPMGLKETEGFAFSVYNINEHRYLGMNDFLNLCSHLDFPVVKIDEKGPEFNKDNVHTLGEGTYANGKQREGVVVRSQDSKISFKVINLNYEK